jgi:hypothetical protein
LGLKSEILLAIQIAIVRRIIFPSGSFKKVFLYKGAEYRDFFFRKYKESLKTIVLKNPKYQLTADDNLYILEK